MQTIVEVDSVYKSYGPSQVISHCSFRLNQGEIYGLLGVNGAGKTTLMKLILGLQKIDSGRILILGREADGSPGNLSEIGSIIETPVFYERLNAEELLSMHLTLMDKKAHIPIYLVSGIFGITPKLTGEHFVLLVLFSSLLVGLLAFEAALICAWTGFKKRSVITTILCSLILVCFLPNLMAGLPKGIAWVMVILSALLGLAAFILYHLLAKEIERMEI